MIAGAEAGLLHLTGEHNGPPVRPGLGVTDMSTGLFMHGAIMAALYSRKETGLGQRVDASLFESQVALLSNVAMSWLNLGQEAERWGTQHPSVVPYDAFQTQDLYFVCGAVNNKQFEKLCTILKLEHLLEDDCFKTNSARVTNREGLMPQISRAFKAKSASEWMEAFEGSGMPYAPINTMEKVFSHPQTTAREMVKELDFEHTRSGKISLLGTLPPSDLLVANDGIRLSREILGDTAFDQAQAAATRRTYQRDTKGSWHYRRRDRDTPQFQGCWLVQTAFIAISCAPETSPKETPRVTSCHPSHLKPKSSAVAGRSCQLTGQ